MEQTIRILMKNAMLEKDNLKKLTYKSILEGAQKLAKNDGNRAATDSDFIKAMKNEIKMQEALLPYVVPGSKKANEITIIIGYCEALLPKMASEIEIQSFLTGEGLEKNMGVCMKALKTHFGETLDGKLAQSLVKSYVNS